MSRNRKALGWTTLLVVVLAVVALRWDGGRLAAPRPSAPPVAAPGSTPERGAVLEAPVGARDPSAEERSRGAGRDTPATGTRQADRGDGSALTASSSGTEPDPETWILRGRLEAATPFDGTEARVALLRKGEVLGACTPDFLGNFEMEVGEDPFAGERFLTVRADHPEFAVAFDRPYRMHRPPRVLRADPHLRPPYALVEAVVENPGPEGHAALFELRDGQPIPPARDRKAIRGDAAVLRVPSPGEYLLVALTEDRLPAWGRVVIDEPQPGAVSLRCEGGRTVAVHVRLPGEVSAEGCLVQVVPAGLWGEWHREPTVEQVLGQRHLDRLHWRGLAWSEETGVVRILQEEEAEPDGLCLLEHLPAGPLLIGVQDVPGPPGAEEDGLVFVPAEDRDVLLVPELALLHVRVDDGVHPLPGARVEVVEQGRATIRTTDEHGRAELLVTARASLSWEVHAPAHLPRAGERQAPPPAGEATMHVALEPAPEGLDSLVLIPPADVEVLELLWSPEGSGEVFHARLPVEDGRARLGGLPRGRVVLRPSPLAEHPFVPVSLPTDDPEPVPLEAQGNEYERED